jgi:hypothetical protein
MKANDILPYNHRNILVNKARKRTFFYPKPPAFSLLLGFRFAPRIRDLADKKLYTINSGNTPEYRLLQPLIGGKIQLRSIEHNWDELLRLATSIRNGTVTASRMLRKLGSYPRQNSLALALRELGRSSAHSLPLTGWSSRNCASGRSPGSTRVKREMPWPRLYFSTGGRG